jgi:ATP-dependent Lhr-like helicase
MAAIDALVRQGLSPEGLPEATQVVYVSPLKALSNDIHLNLEAPLEGIRAELERMGLPDVAIRTAVRTGDTTQSERARMRKTPPHILVTTPESLFVLLGSDSGRAMLATARTVIVDEIHAVAASKRGSHLALSLERLDALCGRRLTRVGLSATQKPIEEVARFLVGASHVEQGVADCDIVDIGYARERDLALEVPPTPLQAVMSNEQWEQVYTRIAQLVRRTRPRSSSSTRAAWPSAPRGIWAISSARNTVAAHHGSLAKELRLAAEQRSEPASCKVLSRPRRWNWASTSAMSTCGAARIAARDRRLPAARGRSGHFVGGVPKGRLFPQSRDDLAECAACWTACAAANSMRCACRGRPIDVLAQQIVAEVCAQEWDEDALFALVRNAWPYAQLPRKAFDDIVEMLVEGFTTRRGHARATCIAMRSTTPARTRGRKQIAVMSGGTIPDTGDYAVLLEPQVDHIGTVNEDFAIESLAGDIFQLATRATASCASSRPPARRGCAGHAAEHPVLAGRSAGAHRRTLVRRSRLRTALAERVEASEDPMGFLTDEGGPRRSRRAPTRRLLRASDHRARHHADAAAHRAGALLRRIRRDATHPAFALRLTREPRVGPGVAQALLPQVQLRTAGGGDRRRDRAVAFDQPQLPADRSRLVPASEFGARHPRAGAARRAAVRRALALECDDGLALPRFVGGKKVAPQLQRMKSEDLLATVFPDQVACAENLVGEREVPEHPLVAQTLDDCLHDAMDAEGWLAVLRGMGSGEIEVVARDLTAPSPFAAEALNARPVCVPRRCAAGRAPHAGRHGAPLCRDDTPGDLARLDPPRSTKCARRPGPTRATPTKCTRP